MSRTEYEHSEKPSPTNTSVPPFVRGINSSTCNNGGSTSARNLNGKSYLHFKNQMKDFYQTCLVIWLFHEQKSGSSDAKSKG